TADGVYLSFMCGNNYKLNPADGSIIARRNGVCTGSGGETPVLYNGRLFVRDPGSNADWIYDTQAFGLAGVFHSTSAPVFSGNRKFVLNPLQHSGGVYGSVEAQDITNDELVYWRVDGDGFLQSSMLVVNNYVYVGSNSGKLYALEAANGRLAWSTTAGTSIPSVAEWQTTQPLTGFAAAEGILVVPTDTTLVAYEQDPTPTITWGTPQPAPNGLGWNKTPVQLPFTVVAHSPAAVFSDPASPLLFNAEGNNQTQQVTASNEDGLSVTLTSPVIRIDLNAPVTTSAVAGTVAPGITQWYKESAQVTLTATDNLSGLQGTVYTIDGGPTKLYSSPFTIQTDGSHMVNYWTTDKAGNTETPQSRVVNVDINAPVTQISAGSGYYASPTQVTLTATDSGSGVANTFYTVASGGTQTYSGPFTVSGDGNRLIVYWSVDWAGHSEIPHFFNLNLDGVAPTTSISFSGTNGWDSWRTSAVQ